MKLLQLYVPEDRDAVFEELTDLDIDYMRLDAENRGGSLVTFPLPEEGVDDVLERLAELGLGDKDYTVIAEADAVTSRHFEDLRKRYTEEEEDERVSSEQLRDRAEERNPSWGTFLATAFLSAVIVAGGLLRNSAAAVAGAMVIAPYFGTTLSVSVGAVSLDRYLFVDGIKHQAVGLLVSIGAAAAVGWVARQFALVPPSLQFTDIGQVSIFLTPTALSIFVAVAAGTAGALTFATATQGALSGAAIAAAIIPSAGAIGLGIAWGDPVVVAGAGALLVVNVISINAAAIATLLLLGNFPSKFSFDRDADDRAGRLAVGVVVVAVLLAATGGAVLATTEHVAYDRQVNDAVADVTDRPAYEGVTVQGVQTSFAGARFLPSRRAVTVQLERPAGERYPDLPADIEAALRERTGHPVTVHVQYVTNRPSDRRTRGARFADGRGRSLATDTHVGSGRLAAAAD